MSKAGWYEVTMKLPITLRFWADSEVEASKEAMRTRFYCTVPRSRYSSGFPEGMEVKEIKEPTPTVARERT